MANQPTNLLILMSDEHTRKVLGCYGNDLVKTPNLDRLAARGTRFTDAYTPCPICVPARASFATGLYGHATGHWDNATPYIGEPRSWGHRLRENGNLVGSIGKLHYRNTDDPTGFDFQELPMHLVNGVGDVLGCVREPLPRRWKSRAVAEKIGPGESGYTAYDRQITDTAVEWIEARADEPPTEKPWTVFVSLVAPHFPLIAPEEYYALYGDSGVMPTKPVDDPEHPWLAELRRCFVYDNFTEEKTRIALASYYGLVSFLDANIGRVLDALDATGLAATTRVVYVSDHGDNIGERELWGKSNFFEEAVGIPAIIAGPDIPEGHVCPTPINLTDVYPTVMECMGLDDDGESRPGRSMIAIANGADDPERAVFSEYHAAGACTGAFMIRKGRWKYLHYVGLEPQLFDLENDPEERNDLGTDPRHADVRRALKAELLAVCDPDDVDRRAKADQSAIVEKHGGIDAVTEKGGYGATPAPGDKPEFVKAT
jgi:choline-sulfatase